MLGGLGKSLSRSFAHFPSKEVSPSIVGTIPCCLGLVYNIALKIDCESVFSRNKFQWFRFASLIARKYLFLATKYSRFSFSVRLFPKENVFLYRRFIARLCSFSSFVHHGFDFVVFRLFGIALSQARAISVKNSSPNLLRSSVTLISFSRSRRVSRKSS